MISRRGFIKVLPSLIFVRMSNKPDIYISLTYIRFHIDANWFMLDNESSPTNVNNIKIETYSNEDERIAQEKFSKKFRDPDYTFTNKEFVDNKINDNVIVSLYEFKMESPIVGKKRFVNGIYKSMLSLSTRMPSLETLGWSEWVRTKKLDLLKIEYKYNLNNSGKRVDDIYVVEYYMLINENLYVLSGCGNLYNRILVAKHMDSLLKGISIDEKSVDVLKQNDYIYLPEEEMVNTPTWVKSIANYGSGNCVFIDKESKYLLDVLSTKISINYWIHFIPKFLVNDMELSVNEAMPTGVFKLLELYTVSSSLRDRINCFAVIFDEYEVKTWRKINFKNISHVDLVKIFDQNKYLDITKRSIPCVDVFRNIINSDRNHRQHSRYESFVSSFHGIRGVLGYNSKGGISKFIVYLESVQNIEFDLEM